MGLPPLRYVASAALFGLACAASAASAFAQYAVTVTGAGYARECYLEVKSGKALPAAILQACNIALEQEDLSQTNRAATHINRGILHMREQHHERAMKDYEAALRISPDMPEAKINLGAMLYNLGRYGDAVAALDEGVKIENGDARAAAHFNRALAHERLGEVDSAYADYKAALAIRPGYAPAERQLRRFSIVPASAP